MRLLERNNHNGFTLTKNFADNIPAYAILSHTWGEDEAEVSFRNMEDGCGRDKRGYTKIQFCGDQAARDGLRYFWVDTCCIDKSSSAELSEAINSMYRWYREAAACYVYMVDVSAMPIPGEALRNQPASWVEEFTSSRWFTRGWTLQELLAPRFVHFWSKDWKYIGNKQWNLRRKLAEITAIEERIVNGGDISKESIANRMSWAANRQTTRPEDMAYCLMGIFQVNMPMLYGEGRDRAFLRLQEEILKVSSDRSIFLWTEPNASPYVHKGLLASSPAAFTQCFEPIRAKEAKPYRMTNKGLKIHVYLIPRPDYKEEYHAILSHELLSQQNMCGITLKKVYEDTYCRVDIQKLWYPTDEHFSQLHKPTTVFVHQNPDVPLGIDPARIKHVVIHHDLAAYLTDIRDIKRARNRDLIYSFNQVDPVVKIRFRPESSLNFTHLPLDVKFLAETWTGNRIKVLSSALIDNADFRMEIFVSFRLIHHELDMFVDFLSLMNL